MGGLEFLSSIETLGVLDAFPAAIDWFPTLFWKVKIVIHPEPGCLKQCMKRICLLLLLKTLI